MSSTNKTSPINKISPIANIYLSNKISPTHNIHPSSYIKCIKKTHLMGLEGTFCPMIRQLNHSCKLYKKVRTGIVTLTISEGMSSKQTTSTIFKSTKQPISGRSNIKLVRLIKTKMYPLTAIEMTPRFNHIPSTISDLKIDSKWLETWSCLTPIMQMKKQIKMTYRITTTSPN